MSHSTSGDLNNFWIGLILRWMRSRKMAWVWANRTEMINPFWENFLKATTFLVILATCHVTLATYLVTLTAYLVTLTTYLVTNVLSCYLQRLSILYVASLWSFKVKSIEGKEEDSADMVPRRRRNIKNCFAVVFPHARSFIFTMICFCMFPVNAITV